MNIGKETRERIDNVAGYEVHGKIYKGIIRIMYEPLYNTAARAIQLPVHAETEDILLALLGTEEWI